MRRTLEPGTKQDDGRWPSARLIQTAVVVENRVLCREHYRLALSVECFPKAAAGQFIHLSPELRCASTGLNDAAPASAHDAWAREYARPMLRRAFSIAGLRRGSLGRTERGGARDPATGVPAEVDVIYRVVGAATRWMKSLRSGDFVSVLGPLGNRFPIRRDKRLAWLVAGGVGLPPMLWLAEELHAAGVQTTAFCGVQSASLMPLSLETGVSPDRAGAQATLAATEFARCGVPVVLSTDDGSLGFHGHVGAALQAFAATDPPAADDLVVYTCGPERMMRFVAEFCAARDVECYACMERAMACGTGTCQSCVVAVHDDSDADGWSYRLCCTEGPVFAASQIIWDRT